MRVTSAHELTKTVLCDYPKCPRDAEFFGRWPGEVRCEKHRDAAWRTAPVPRRYLARPGRKT